MIDNRKYYKMYDMAELTELLAVVTKKYTTALPGESEQTLNGYRELVSFLQSEIQERACAGKNMQGDRGYGPAGNNTITSYISP